MKSRNPGVEACGRQGPPPSHLCSHCDGYTPQLHGICKLNRVCKPSIPSHPPLVFLSAPQASIIGGIRTGLLVGSC